MADTIKVPGIKEPLPKWAVLGGVAVTGVAIIIYYRKRGQAGAVTGTDALGLASGGIAPASGLADSGTFPWDGTYGDPSDPYSMDTSTGNTFGNEGLAGNTGGSGAGGGFDSGQPSGPPFSSNQQWSAYVLQQDGGAHPAMAQALGLYLDGRPLTTAEQDLIYQAQAIAGRVPVAGSGGYPPKLRAAPAQGGGGKGGMTFAENPVTGLRASGGPASVTVQWNPSARATGYQVSAQNLTVHRSAGSATTAHTTYTFRGLKIGDTFEVTVLARPAEKGAQPAKAQARPIGATK